MIAWLQAAPAFLAAAALVLLPGLPLALLLRLRGLALLAGATAASFAFITVSSLLGPVLGLTWSALLPLGFGLLVFLTTWPIFRRLSFRPIEPVLRSLGWPVLALLVSAVLIGSLVRAGLGSPETISQSYDNVFHLNLIQFILDGGDASPVHMTLAVPDRPFNFYPNTWHSTAALVSQLAGVSANVATSAMIVVTTCLVWPIAILFFAAPLLGPTRQPRHLFTIAVLASGFSAFPYLLLRWGVLYPNLLSTALIPIALGFLHAALRRRYFGLEIGGVAAWVALFGSLSAGIAAHPNAMFGFAAIAVPLALATLPAFVRAAPNAWSRAARVSMVIVPFVVIFVLWGKLSTSDNTRVFESGVVTAFISGVTNAPLLDSRAWFATVLVLSGVIVALTTRGLRWLAPSYAVVIGLYTIASGTTGPLRTMITGLWYNDANRLASLTVIVAVPLAALALARLTDVVAASGRPGVSIATGPVILPPKDAAPTPSTTTLSRAWSPGTSTGLIIALVLIAAAFGMRGASITQISGQINDLHRLDEESWLLSTNEIELMEKADAVLPKDAVIAGNPWNGSAFALTYAHREVLFPHLGGDYGEDAAVVARELKDATPAACAAAERLGVGYVMDLGDLYTIGGSSKRELDYPGLTDVAGSPALTPILSEGDAVLYRLDGCG